MKIIGRKVSEGRRNKQEIMREEKRRELEGVRGTER